MKRILLLNGPNLDMLGKREPDIYGKESLAKLEEKFKRYAAKRGIKVECVQSNSEAKLVKQIHKAAKDFDGIVFNPGAHTHYSYAIRDAIASVDVPIIEVHISNIDEREPFRRISVTAPVCIGQIKGLGFDGYLRGIDALMKLDELVRLGEGFETRYPASENIILAFDDTKPLPSKKKDKAKEKKKGNKHEHRAGGLQEQMLEQQLAAQLVTRSVVQMMDQPMEQATAQPMDQQMQKQVHAQQLLQQQVVQQVMEQPTQQQVLQPSEQQAQHIVQRSVQQQMQQDMQQPVPTQAESIQQLRQQVAVAPIDTSLVSLERMNLLRLSCSCLGVGAMLIRDTANIEWLTALDGVFDEERAHALVVAANLAVLHTDSRYANALRNALEQNHIDVALSDERVSHARFAHDVLNPPEHERFMAKLGIEDSITYAEFVKLVEAFTSEWLAPTTDVVLNLRAVKDAGELTRLNAAQTITDAAFDHIVRYIKPGMTEREVQIELDHFMLTHGADGLAFSSIVACGQNGADPHSVPGDAKLEAGQCVVLDFGARAFGYCSDMTRTIFLGQPNEQMTEAWQALRQTNEEVEALLRPGVTGKQAHELAESILASHGFEGKMGHGLGHGVGLEIHELPVLNPRNELELVVGNVVTVEPGIYLPGEFGMRLEDFGVVTERGFHVFTQSTHEMVII